MKKYLEEVKNRIGSLEVKFIQIPREENECIDRLAKAASVEFMIAPEQVLSFVQTSSLIDDGANVRETNSEKNWTTPSIAYLRSGILPVGKEAARKLKVQALWFVIIKDVLYKKRILSTVPEVFEPRGSKLRDERNPRRYLWKPLGGTIIGAQDNLSRILLAYNAEGRTSLRQSLRQMSKVQ